jgi:hypothetical protein
MSLVKRQQIKYRSAMCEKCDAYILGFQEKLNSTPFSEWIIVLLGELQENVMKLYKCRQAAEKGGITEMETLKEVAIRVNVVSGILVQLSAQDAFMASATVEEMKMGGQHLDPEKARAIGAELLEKMKLNGMGSTKGSA